MKNLNLTGNSLNVSIHFDEYNTLLYEFSEFGFHVDFIINLNNGAEVFIVVSEIVRKI